LEVFGRHEIHIPRVVCWFTIENITHGNLVSMTALRSQ
jgi:hypothetical protein